ncbi:ribonuclease BN [Haladaptatus sp. GCM10025707]|uniref:DUF7139 domain-containing protein n=1 Tax=unclassified Haladaptatus TaxID=2622732 RepID=UPI0023E7EF4E|nr:MULTISPECIES: hypothetical protein [unclassified Haladaptatus]
MTSLTEVYERNVGTEASLQRLYLGLGLFGVGAVLVVLGIIVATTQVVGDILWQSREVAGVLAGIGLPAVFVGIFSVLPAGRRTRVLATLGASVSLLGVALFWYAFPKMWFQDPVDLTLPVVAVYFLGTMTTLWCLFAGVTNFKVRNKPGGTVKLEVTKEGKTRIVAVDGPALSGGLGGIGLLGAQPDGEVETQTAVQKSRQTSRHARQMSDGGADARQRRDMSFDDGAELLDQPRQQRPADPYCGNCAHFQYVQTTQGRKPYCGAHDELMSDMEPCAQWQSNLDD